MNLTLFSIFLFCVFQFSFEVNLKYLDGKTEIGIGWFLLDFVWVIFLIRLCYTVLSRLPHSIFCSVDYHKYPRLIITHCCLQISATSVTYSILPKHKMPSRLITLLLYKYYFQLNLGSLIRRLFTLSGKKPRASNRGIKKLVLGGINIAALSSHLRLKKRSKYLRVSRVRQFSRFDSRSSIFIPPPTTLYFGSSPYSTCVLFFIFPNVPSLSHNNSVASCFFAAQVRFCGALLMGDRPGICMEMTFKSHFFFFFCVVDVYIYV